jgi:hypothetical protein
MFCAPTSQKETAMKKLLVVLVGSLLCCVSCGSEDDPIFGGVPGSAPQIADLECDPSSATVGDGNGAVTVECTANFADADMDLETMVVRFRRNCGGGAWQEATEDVISQTAGLTQGEVNFDFIAETDCPPSNYPYEVSARDGTNRVSNILTLQFNLEEEEPPL